MANENKNSNELVDDDDPTVELELPKFAKAAESALEVDAQTYDAPKASEDDSTAGVTVSELQSDLRVRQKTIHKLQYDIEQLHSRWVGLEAEIGARETQTERLNNELRSAHGEIARSKALLAERDQELRSLQAELDQRNEDYQHLKSRFDDSPQITESSSADTHSDIEALQRKLSRSEQYADTLRQKSQDLIAQNQNYEQQFDNLNKQLDESKQSAADMLGDLQATQERTQRMQSELDNIQGVHEAEIRTLRFELGQAQDTVVETEDVNSQLTSDLIDARGFKDELERMLGDVEEKSSERIDELQKQLSKLKRKADHYQQKLDTKSHAISVLLAELAKKSEQANSIGEIEEVIQDIDERMSERSLSNNDSGNSASVDRITRLLIGTIDGQVLRFPLFKDRLTIGRTNDNDIQLKAAYVSRRHALIETHGDETTVVDSGSKNGIHINSAKVSKHIFKHGDILAIGNARFRYEERKKRDG